VLYKEDKGVFFGGWVSKRLLHQFMQLHDSGVWSYIRNIYGESIHAYQINDLAPPFQSTKLNGNIAIIFVVFGSGQAVAIISFLIELRSRLCRASKLACELATRHLITDCGQTKVSVF